MSLFGFNRQPFLSPEGAIGGTGEVAAPDTGAGETDPFASLSDINLEDEEPETEPETDPEAQPGTQEGDAETAEQQQERTSKQPPEVDAAFARARKAEEKAQQLEQQLANEQARRDTYYAERFGQSHGIFTEAQYHAALERSRVEQEQQQERQQFDQQWNNVVAEAGRMKEQGHDPDYVDRWVHDQRERINDRMELHKLRSELNQTKQQGEQSIRQQQEAQAVKNFFADIKALRDKHGDMIPDIAGVRDDINGLRHYVSLLPQEMVNRIQRGYSPEDAFLVTNHEQLAKKEKSLAEKRTVANIADRTKKTVETGGNEPKPEEILSKFQIGLAKDFGLPLKEVAKRTKRK